MKYLAIAVVLIGLAAPARAASDPFAYDPRVAADPATTEIVRAERPDGRGILWVHWLGDPSTSNRSEFRTEAQALAQRGITSVLVDGMWSRPDWFEKLRSPQNDERDLIAQVVALRRALDLLATQPGVDAGHLMLVGHDFGAMYGALAAAADPRVRDLVLMTPAWTFWEWFLFTPVPDAAQYVARMSAYDLPRWLPHTHARAVLFQFAKRDPYVAATNALAAKSLLGDRDRTVTSYDAGHALDETARGDRDAWLLAH